MRMRWNKFFASVAVVFQLVGLVGASPAQKYRLAMPYNRQDVGKGEKTEVWALKP